MLVSLEAKRTRTHAAGPTSPATHTTSRLTPPPDASQEDDERQAFEDHGRGQEPVGPFGEVAHIAPVRRHGCCQLLGGWFVGCRY